MRFNDEDVLCAHHGHKGHDWLPRALVTGEASSSQSGAKLILDMSTVVDWRNVYFFR